MQLTEDVEVDDVKDSSGGVGGFTLVDACMLSARVVDVEGAVVVERDSDLVSGEGNVVLEPGDGRRRVALRGTGKIHASVLDDARRVENAARELRLD